MKELFKSAAVIIAAFFAMLQFSLAQSPSDAYQTESFETGSSPEVNIRTSGGKIAVHGHDENSVTVEMYVQRRGDYLSPSDTDLSDYEIEISQHGNVIVASASSEKSNGGWFNWFRSDSGLSISFVVKVPNGAEVNGRTSGGPVSAENLLNNTTLRTSGGSVTVRGVQGISNFRTSGGSITLEDVHGEVVARTSGGSVRVSNISGEVDLRTSGGGITIEQSRAKLSARTSGGSIRADLLELNQDVHLRTSGGSITVAVPPIDHFSLDLSANRVNTEFRNFTGSMDRSNVKGKVGDGGPMIYARTSGGSITLNWL